MKFVISMLAIAATGIMLASCAAGFKQNGYIYSHLDTLVTKGTVRIIDPVSGEEYTKKLDVSGKFVFEDIPIDTVILRIESPNYIPYEEKIVLKEDLPDPPAIFRLEPLKTKIHGRVVDENGVPIAGAIITTDITGRELSELTDDNGRYELLLEGYEDVLEAEGWEINVSASKIGYSTNSQWDKAAAHQDRTIKEIILKKKKISTLNLGGVGQMEIEDISGGGFSPTDNMEFDNTMRQFLMSHRNRTFTRKQFIDYMVTKRKDPNMAEIDLKTLIQNGRVKKVGRDTYKFIGSF